jgi:hypothetical protein
MRVSENESGDTTGGCRNLGDELQNVKYPPNITMIYQGGWVSGVCSTQKNTRNAYTPLLGKPEGRGQNGRHALKYFGIRMIRMCVLWQEARHLLLIRTNLGRGTVLTAACARQGCSAINCYYVRL